MTDMPREKAREWDKGSICPAEVMKKLGAMGLMGLTVEERFGGAGVDIYATMAVIEEIAKRSVAVACPYIMAVCYAGMNLGESASRNCCRKSLRVISSLPADFPTRWTWSAMCATRSACPSLADRPTCRKTILRTG